MVTMTAILDIRWNQNRFQTIYQ